MNDLAIEKFQAETEKMFPKLYDAIKEDNYRELVEIFTAPEFDINQFSIDGYYKGISIEGNLSYINSAMSYAISLGKTSLVELFLLMGANPYQAGNPTSTPIANINDANIKPEDKELMLSIFKKQPNINSNFCSINKINFSNEQILYIDKNFMDEIFRDNHKILQSKLSNIRYTDACCNYNYHYTALVSAILSTSITTVKLFIDRGAIISNACVRKYLKEFAEESWIKPIAKLLQLEKERQITIMKIFALYKGNIDDCRDYIIEFNKKHKEQTNILTETKNPNLQWDAVYEANSIILNTIPEYKNVSEKINQLDTYGRKLNNSGKHHKYQKILEVVNNLKKILLNYHTEELNKDRTNNELRLTFNQAYKALGEDRNIQDYLAHIALAITGIGLLIMSINKICYGSFFLNNTKRQDMLKEIEESFNSMPRLSLTH